ncbi:MAG: murein biosynthesis integral membrane protein MurJ [Eubacteriales bacterium]
MFGVSFRWIKIYSSVIVISLVSKITGFFRDAVITARFGATLVTDAYVVALLIPEVLFNIFGNSLTANFAPIYYETERLKKHRRFVSTLFSLYLLLAGLIFVFGFRNTKLLITIFSSGFNGQAFDTTTFLLKIFMANVFFITVTYICLAFLQAHNQFLVPSTIGIFYNLAIIASMCYKGAGPALHILIIGTLAGYITQFAVQLPQAISRGLPMPTWRMRLTPEIKKYLVLSLPVAVLAVLGQLNIAMDNYFASRLNEGSITTLNLGYRVLMGIYSLFITNTMMIVYPALSKSIVQNDSHHTKAIIQKTTNLLIILLLPLALYLFCNAGPLIDLMFKRGAFTARQSALTATVFQGYIVGLVFFAFRDLLLRYFFAEHNAVIPMVNGLLNSTLNFIYLVVMVPYMGLPGVSSATALSAVSSCSILYLWARKKAPAFRQLEFTRLGLKILWASGLSVLAMNLTKPLISGFSPGETVFCQLFRLGAGFVVFSAFYGLVFLIMFSKKIFGFLTR